MPNQKLVKFIQEARKRGFDDFQIREPLIQKGWPVNEVEEAFSYLRRKTDKVYYKNKNRLTIYLDNEMLKSIEKRASRNMFTVNEQIEDILRRSCVNTKKKNSFGSEKLDDMFIGLFSRRSTGRQRDEI